MKSILSLIFIGFLSISIVNGATITSVAGTAWNLPTTWDLGRVPIEGDDIIVNHDVTMTNNPGVSFGTLQIGGAAKTIFSIGEVGETYNIDVTFTAITITIPSAVIDIYEVLRGKSISTSSTKVDVNIYSTGKLYVTDDIALTGNQQEFNISNSGQAEVGGDFTIVDEKTTATISGSLDVEGTVNNGGTITVPTGGMIDASNYTGNLPTGTGIILKNGWLLPIELTSFSAQKSANNITINWQTATEINNDYFTIERSADAVNYEIIGTVAGAGNSSTAINYSYVDNNPLNGVAYYRLTQTDYNGDFETFDPVSVSFLNEDALNIGPNPAINEINVSLNGEMGAGSIQVYNMIGAQVRSIEVESNFTTIDISDLPLGTYMVVFTAGENKVMKRILVQ